MQTFSYLLSVDKDFQTLHNHFNLWLTVKRGTKTLRCYVCVKKSLKANLITPDKDFQNLHNHFNLWLKNKNSKRTILLLFIPHF